MCPSGRYAIDSTVISSVIGTMERFPKIESGHVQFQQTQLTCGVRVWTLTCVHYVVL